MSTCGDCLPTTPAPVNQCNDLGNVYTIPGLCVENSNVNALLPEWCESNISSAGEWELSSATQCQTLNVSPFIDGISNADTCSPICQLPGFTANCSRIGFNGDPLTCCMEDNTCNTSSPNTCFEFGTTGVSQNTCSPETRNITSTTCQDLVSLFCAGADLPIGDTSWISRWIDVNGQPLTYNPDQNPLENGCLYPITRNVFSTIDNVCGQSGPKSAAGYLWAQSLMSQVFNRYQEDGLIFGSLPGTPGYTVFQEFLANPETGLCNVIPGLCISGLEAQCVNYTTNDIIRNPELADICGCYLPDAEYETYINNYGLTKQCTPMCNRASTIPLADGEGSAIVCEQSVCLIDDVTVNIINSRVKGGIDVENICGGCSGGSCQCILQDLTVDVFNSVVGDNVVISQACGSSLCTSTVNGNVITAPCDDTTGDDPLQDYESEVAQAQSNANRRYWVFVAVILLSALIIILAFLFFYKEKISGGTFLAFFGVVILITVIVLVLFFVFEHK